MCKFVAVFTIEVREKLHDKPINRIFPANKLRGDKQSWLGIWCMGKETWYDRKVWVLIQLCHISWSLMIYLTSLGLHLLFYINENESNAHGMVAGIP